MAKQPSCRIPQHGLQLLQGVQVAKSTKKKEYIIQLVQPIHYSITLVSTAKKSFAIHNEKYYQGKIIIQSSA